MDEANKKDPVMGETAGRDAQYPNAETEKEIPFYNVMPKENFSGPLIDAKIKIAEAEPGGEASQGAFGGFFRAHKGIIILIIGILILAYPIYRLVDKYLIGSLDEGSLLSDEAVKMLEAGAGKPKEEAPGAQYTTPGEWQERYFGESACENNDQCGDEADPDRDGLKNIEEFGKETDPNNPDSDQDGLSDGDEVYVFDSNPALLSTSGDANYNDGDYILGGYNPRVLDALLSPSELADITAKMKQFGLRQPTLGTLGVKLLELYKFTTDVQEAGEEEATTTDGSALEGMDISPEAKQDRDTQRSNTIKNIAIALVKYYDDKQAYPLGDDFSDMFNSVKVYLKVASNPADPINQREYVYTYAAADDGQDFTLTFYSETQNQIIRTRSQDAKKYKQQEEAALYDDQRKNSLETLRTALLLYSANNAAGNQEYAFPTKENYQTALVPQFIGEIPKDPKTQEPYDYQVPETYDTFTLKAILDAPPTGRTGWLCNQEECRYY